MLLNWLVSPAQLVVALSVPLIELHFVMAFPQLGRLLAAAARELSGAVHADSEVEASDLRSSFLTALPRAHLNGAPDALLGL